MSDAGTPGPPPPPPPPPSAPADTIAPAVRSGASNAVIGIISAVALVLVAGLGVGIGAFVLNQSASSSTSSQSVKDDSPTEEDEDDEESTSTPTPTATPIETADAPAAVTDPAVVFQSESGNIVCSVTKVSAVCHQNNIKYTVPSSACATALGGATVGVDRRSTFWPCVDAAFAGAVSQAYDAPVVAYDFTCNINYVSGVTCYNEEGSGFTMEYANGIETF